MDRRELGAGVDVGAEWSAEVEEEANKAVGGVVEVAKLEEQERRYNAAPEQETACDQVLPEPDED
jgi:hypothetical protein